MNKSTRTSSKNRSVSQRDRVLAILSRKTRNTITQTQANELGIKNLRARISELRNDDGLMINTDFLVNRDGSTEAVYSL